MKFRPFPTQAASLLILLNPFAVSSVSAQEWTGGGASDSVSDLDNWNPLGIPANDGSSDLIFDGSTRTTPVFDSPWDFNSLTFASGAGSFALGGSQLILGGSTGGLLDSMLTVDSSLNQSIGNSILLGRDQTWSSSNGGNLSLTGDLDLAGSDLRLDFGSGALQLNDAGRILSGTAATVHLASGTLQLTGANDDGVSATLVDRISNNIGFNLAGGNLSLVSDDNSGQAAIFVTESIGAVTVNDTSSISVVSSANHVAGARLNVGSVTFANSPTGTPFLKTFVEGAGNRLDLGTYLDVKDGQRLEISTANGGILEADNIYVLDGGRVDFVQDASGAFGSVAGKLSVYGTADFDSSGGANEFGITGSLNLYDSADIRMTLGDSGSDRVNVSGGLRLDGTLSITENAASSLTGSQLFTLFTYGGSLNNNGLELASGSGLLGNPDWKFTVSTAFAGEVNLVASEVRNWDGDGGDGLFSTVTNWDADKSLFALDHLVFDPASDATLTNDYDAGSIYGGIEVGGTNNANLTFNGNQANLSSGIIINGGDQTFNLSLTPNALDFESSTIVVNGGSATFNEAVTMLPGLNFKMEVADGSSVTFNGDISGSKLFKTGTTATGGQSTVTLTGVGTFDGAAGGSSITQGDLVLAGENGALVLSGNPQLDLKGLPDSQARLVIDNSAHANTDRISDNSLIAMFGNSSVKFIGNGTTGVTENLTGLALFDGVTRFEFDAPAGVASGLVFNQYAVGKQRTDSNYLAVTDTSGALGTGGANPFLKFTAGIADGTLIGRGSYNGTDLLAYDAANGLRAATTITTTVGAVSSDHLRLDSSETLAGPLTVKSLALNGSTLDGAGALTVSSGMILGAAGSELAVNTNATGSSGLTIIDAQGDTTVSGVMTAASKLEKWGEGNLVISGSGQVVVPFNSSGGLTIYQGTVTAGRDNAIVSGGFYAPNLQLRNGSTLDLGSYSQSFNDVTIDHGGLIDGTGTLTANVLTAGRIPNFTAAGDAVTINSNLNLYRFTEDSQSAGVVINGDVAFDNTVTRRSDIYVRNNTAFNGAVDFGENSRISLSGSGDKSLAFTGAVASEQFDISSSGSGQAAHTITFDGTVGASGLFIDADAATDLRFNNTVSFSPSTEITSPTAQFFRGEVTLGGENGAFSGLDSLSLGSADGSGNLNLIRKSTGLTLDNATFANSNRIDDLATVNIEAGSALTLVGNSISDVTEVLGSVSLNSGETTLNILGDPGAQSTLQLTSLNRTADNVLFVNSSGGTLGAGANSPNLLIDDATAGFMSQTILNGTGFATYDAVNGVKGVASLASINGAGVSDHVALGASESVALGTSFQSLNLANGVAVDGADLTVSTGHLLLGDGSSVTNNVSSAGDAFLYNNGSSSLTGNVSIGGDARKAGSGSLTVGSGSTSLSVGAGKTLFIDGGTVVAGGDNAIASGTNVQLRESALNTNYSLALADVTLRSGADITGTGSISAGTLTVDNSNPSRFTTGGSTYLDASLGGATNLVIKGGTERYGTFSNETRLRSQSTYTGTTSIDGVLVLSDDASTGRKGAIANSSLIEIGKNSTAPTSTSMLHIGSLTTNRIGDDTAIDFYNRSSLVMSTSVSTQEVVGDVSVMDKAVVRLSTQNVNSGTSLLMNSFTSTNAVTTLSEGNTTNFLANSVTINGVAINNGQIVPTVFRNNSPVEWVSGVLKAVTPIQWSNNYSGGGSYNFVTVTSAFNLNSNTNVEYIRFESTDPFNSTPGTTLFVQSGLFFSAENGNTMNSQVSIGANGSISTNSIVRFTDQLEAADDLNVIGGGTTVIDGGATVVGLTSIRDGKLVVGEGNSATVFTGDITVFNGSSLGGSGTIAGNVLIESGGKSLPGNSPGILTITGNLQYDAQSIAEFELAQIGASDMIVVNGDLLFDGQMDLQLFALSGITTGTYTLFDYTGDLTGFENLLIDDEVGLGANSGFDALLINNLANKTIDLQINSLGVTVIPEPATSLLAVLGITLCAFRRRRVA